MLLLGGEIAFSLQNKQTLQLECNIQESGDAEKLQSMFGTYLKL
jgi:hypothetical protein